MWVQSLDTHSKKKEKENKQFVMWYKSIPLQ